MEGGSERGREQGAKGGREGGMEGGRGMAHSGVSRKCLLYQSSNARSVREEMGSECATCLLLIGTHIFLSMARGHLLFGPANSIWKHQAHHLNSQHNIHCLKQRKGFY